MTARQIRPCVGSAAARKLLENVSPMYARAQPRTVAPITAEHPSRSELSMPRLRNIFSGFASFAKVLWLCGYATAFIIAAILFFVVSAQGADFLRLLSEERAASVASWPRSAFYVGVVLWSLASWYSSRLLAIRQLPGFLLAARLPVNP